MVSPMTRPAKFSATPLLYLALASCSAPHLPDGDLDVAGRNVDPTLIEARPRAQAEAANTLLSADPQSWGAAARRFLATRESGAPALITAISRNPTGPGLQIAVATLGKLGDPRAIPILEQLLRERSGISSEAALALGFLPAPQSRALLLEEMLYRGGDPLNRTCAAVALLDLDDVENSLPFLRAVLLAGTPYEISLRDQYGLPDRARWAHERIVAIDAIGRHFDGETFGLDPDSPWPRLKAAVDRMQDAAREQR